MQSANVYKIVVGTRQRKHLDNNALHKLSESIAAYGLLHPIVCVEADGDLRLVAGQRRLEAAKLLAQAGQTYTHDDRPVPLEQIPYILLTNTDDLGIREAELHENIIREDLTWQERAAALDELHKLRCEQNPQQSVRSTAEELRPKTSKSSSNAEKVLSQALIVVPHLDDPEVAAAGSLGQAFKIASRKIEAKFVEELQRRGRATNTQHTLLHGDAAERLGDLPQGCFDCIIADPPYGMGADTFGDNASFAHTYKDTTASALAAGNLLLHTCQPLCKPAAHIYIFCDIELFAQLRQIAVKAGWSPWRTPLIWDKSPAGFAPTHTSGFSRNYECLLFAAKGARLFGHVYSDVLRVSGQIADRQHAAQKPVELYRELLERSCLPGDHVLDPYCGTGTIFPAASLQKVVATGIELDDNTYNLAALRLEGKDG